MDCRKFEYNSDGLLARETWGLDWQTTEYYYTEDGVLESHKRATTYDNSTNQVSAYEITTYDSYGSPIQIENSVGRWEYAYDYASDGTITSVKCGYFPISGENLTNEFDLSVDGEKYFCDYQPISGALVITAIRNENKAHKYMFLENGQSIDIYEVSIHELDKSGNPQKVTKKNGLLREDGGWIEEHYYVNTYDDDGNLISCIKTSDSQRTEQYFLYGYYYTSD